MGQDPEELREEIEATREELGRDLDALAAKANPKRIAQDRVEAVKATASEKGGQVKQAAATGVGTVKVQAQQGVGTAKVKAQQGVGTAKVKAQQGVGQAKSNPKPLAAVGAGLAAVTVLLVWFRRRR